MPLDTVITALDDGRYGKQYRGVEYGVAFPRVRVLSLGAGVQSTVMLLMAERGLLRHKPDVALFADTGWEPQPVYDILKWLESEVKTIPIVRVSQGGRNLRNETVFGHPQHLAKTGKVFQIAPLHTVEVETGKKGMGVRQCTNQFKIEPIHKYVRREMLKLRPRQRMPKDTLCEMWLGITTDEGLRQKDSRDHWIHNYYPLISEKGMSREDCAGWFSEHYPGRPLAKSSCAGCPYRSAKSWIWLKHNDPKAWEDTVWVDAQIRVGAGK